MRDLESFSSPTARSTGVCSTSPPPKPSTLSLRMRQLPSSLFSYQDMTRMVPRLDVTAALSPADLGTMSVGGMMVRDRDELVLSLRFKKSLVAALV
jgi:hypothetical protein